MTIQGLCLLIWSCQGRTIRWWFTMTSWGYKRLTLLKVWWVPLVSKPHPEPQCSGSTMNLREGDRLKDETRIGQPITAATLQNMEAAEKLIKDARITSREIQSILGIGSSAVDLILHKQLGIHKRCAWWVPHALSDEQHWGRIQWCRFMLEKFNRGQPKLAWDIITGDETWVYQFDPQDQAAISGMDISWWLSPYKVQEIKEHWKANGGFFLWKNWRRIPSG